MTLFGAVHTDRTYRIALSAVVLALAATEGPPEVLRRREALLPGHLLQPHVH